MFSETCKDKSLKNDLLLENGYMNNKFNEGPKSLRNYSS